jgi:hypothetical protein
MALILASTSKLFFPVNSSSCCCSSSGRGWFVFYIAVTTYSLLIAFVDSTKTPYHRSGQIEELLSIPSSSTHNVSPSQYPYVVDNPSGYNNNEGDDNDDGYDEAWNSSSDVEDCNDETEEFSLLSSTFRDEGVEQEYLQADSWGVLTLDSDWMDEQQYDNDIGSHHDEFNKVLFALERADQQHQQQQHRQNDNRMTNSYTSRTKPGVRSSSRTDRQNRRRTKVNPSKGSSSDSASPSPDQMTSKVRTTGVKPAEKQRKRKSQKDTINNRSSTGGGRHLNISDGLGPTVDRRNKTSRQATSSTITSQKDSTSVIRRQMLDGESFNVPSPLSNNGRMASSTKRDKQRHQPIQKRTPTAAHQESFPSRQGVPTFLETTSKSPVGRRRYTEDSALKRLTGSPRTTLPVSTISTDPNPSAPDSIRQSPSSSVRPPATTTTLPPPRNDGRRNGHSEVHAPKVSSLPLSKSSSSTPIITPWIRKYLASRPKDMLLPIPRDYLADNFNLAQLPPIIEKIGYHAMGDDAISAATSMTHQQHQQQLFAISEGGGDANRRFSSIQSYPIYRRALQRILYDNVGRDEGLYEGGGEGQQQHTEHDLVIPERAIQQAAEALYLMVHARFVLSPRGLEAIRQVMTMDRTVFGKCPRPLCRGTGLLPYGYSNDYTIASGLQQHRLNHKPQQQDFHQQNHRDHHFGDGDPYGRQSSHHTLCHRYCPSCGEVWVSWESKTDGCAWGPSWCHLFLLSFGTQIFARELAAAAAATPVTATVTPPQSRIMTFGSATHGSAALQSTTINSPRSARQPLARSWYGYLYPGNNNGSNKNNNQRQENVECLTMDQPAASISSPSSSSPPQSIFGFRIHPATPFGRPWNEHGLSVIGGADGRGDRSH